MKKPKFKKRYVLGEGYPITTLSEVKLYTQQVGGDRVILKSDQFHGCGCTDRPEYRLVLERVK